MATYSPGEQVRLQWPAKNHANVGQQRGVQLFFGRAAGAAANTDHPPSPLEISALPSVSAA